MRRDINRGNKEERGGHGRYIKGRVGGMGHGRDIKRGIQGRGLGVDRRHCGDSIQLTCSVVSDSLRPHGLQHTRLLPQT